MAKMNRVWWWVGGTERGEWRETAVQAGEDAKDLVRSIRNQGYVAIPGNDAIGPPEGPPRVEAFDALPGYDRYGRRKGN